MNTQRKKVLLSWSSGKDSAWALHSLRKDSQLEVIGLFTTVNEEYDRVNMHATPLTLLQCQAEATGLPLHVIRIPNPCPMEIYNRAMEKFVVSCQKTQIDCMAFGDLFLQDIRDYRVKMLQGSGIKPIFPIWGIPTKQLALDMLAGGLDAWISSVDLKKLPSSFAGRHFTKEFLSELPPQCDPCGENGEFHTIVANGPMFNHSIAIHVGKSIERDGFAYADISPVNKV